MTVASRRLASASETSSAAAAEKEKARQATLTRPAYVKPQEEVKEACGTVEEVSHICHPLHVDISATPSCSILTSTSLLAHGILVQEEEEMEEMFIMGPKGLEWGGPTRGGRQKEPTRYGDWERRGRCTDFS